jgi:methylated-DNA-protein-cysteine methyltransferase-like protein
MTYGQIAAILGAPRAARAVGYAMRASGRHDDVPWQRVINRQGRISAKNDVERPMIQKVLLEAEGIVFDQQESCELEHFRWEPANPEAYFYEPSDKMPL